MIFFYKNQFLKHIFSIIDFNKFKKYYLINWL